MIIIGAYSIIILVSTFRKENYTLDVTSIEIRSYQEEAEYIYKNSMNCFSGTCIDVYLKDFEKIYWDLNLRIYQAEDCSAFNVGVFLKTFGSTEHRLLRNSSFERGEFEGEDICIFYGNKTMLNDILTVDEQ